MIRNSFTIAPRTVAPLLVLLSTVLVASTPPLGAQDGVPHRWQPVPNEFLVGRHSSPLVGVQRADRLPQRLTQQAREASRTYSNKMAGFAAGVTLGAVVVSTDEVLGSSCRGSGSYLALCRIGFVGFTAVTGGVGALVGRAIQTEQRPGRVKRILIGSALGSVGAFLVSVAGCSQEDNGNPDLLCGYDGMVSPGTIVGGAAIGGILGAVLGGESEGLQLNQFGPVAVDGGRLALGVGFTVPAAPSRLLRRR